MGTLRHCWLDSRQKMWLHSKSFYHVQQNTSTWVFSDYIHILWSLDFLSCYVRYDLSDRRKEKASCKYYTEHLIWLEEDITRRIFSKQWAEINYQWPFKSCAFAFQNKFSGLLMHLEMYIRFKEHLLSSVIIIFCNK